MVSPSAVDTVHAEWLGMTRPAEEIQCEPSLGRKIEGLSRSAVLVGVPPVGSCAQRIAEME